MVHLPASPPSPPSPSLPHLLLRRQLLHSTFTSASHPPVLPHPHALPLVPISLSPLSSGCSVSAAALDGNNISNSFGCRLLKAPPPLPPPTRGGAFDLHASGSVSGKTFAETDFCSFSGGGQEQKCQMLLPNSQL